MPRNSETFLFLKNDSGWLLSTFMCAVYMYTYSYKQPISLLEMDLDARVHRPGLRKYKSKLKREQARPGQIRDGVESKSLYHIFLSAADGLKILKIQTAILAPLFFISFCFVPRHWTRWLNTERWNIFR